MRAVLAFPQPVPTITVEATKAAAAEAVSISNSLRPSPPSSNSGRRQTVVSSKATIQAGVNLSPIKDLPPWAPEALRSSTPNQVPRTWEDKYTWCSPGWPNPMDILWDPNM
jgi:hypothetical protein